MIQCTISYSSLLNYIVGGKMNFEEIINLTSIREIKEATENKNSISFSDLQNSYFKGKSITLPLDELTEDEQRKNIAVYAKLITEHVGFEGFGENNIAGFKHAIETLYNGVSGIISEEEFGKKLMQCQRFILDNHCILVTPTHSAGDNQKKGSQHIEPKRISDLEHTVLYKESNGTEDVCEIGEINQNDEHILFVKFHSFGGRDGSYEAWEDFIRKFDEIYGENGSDWDRIILDVRGNGGGEDKPINHIAQRTYGNHVNSYKRCEIRDTELSDFIYKRHGIFTRFLPEGLDVVSRQNFSNKTKPMFDETSKFYTFNEEQGYHGSIDILTDRGVGSAAESAYTLFYHHPKVRYIGENTRGMQQYQQGWVNLPCGYGMRLGVTKLTYWDKEGENIECIGHKPDIFCESQEALKVALTHSMKPFQHELNEPIPEQAKTPAPNGINPYNPKDKEIRKAYFAQYVEPELERIEFENIINSLSIDDLIKTPIQKNPADKLSLEEQRKMLAFMGRFLYHGHGGFAEGNSDIVFPQAVRRDFIKSFIKLYNSSQEKTLEDNLKDIYKLQMMFIPDNHVYVYNSDGSPIQLSAEDMCVFKKELAKRLEDPNIDLCQRGKIERYLSYAHQVGKNLVEKTSDELTQQKKGIQWKTGTVSTGGKELYVVAISSFAAIDPKTGAFDEKLIDDFISLAKELSETKYKGKDGLVIDLRGNRGGWPYIGDYLARTLYGNTVTSGGASLDRDTLEKEILKAHMRGNFDQKKEDIVQKQFSGNTIEYGKEKWTTRFPFNPKKGITMPIVVLIDRGTGSNAEATCEKLAAHPYVRFVGENTKGCLQFGNAPTSKTALPLPYGGRMGIPLGASASSIIQGRYEGMGITPNYKLETGKDAFSYLIEKFDEIQNSVEHEMQNISTQPINGHSMCEREAYVDNLTVKNVELMQRQGNLKAAEAVKRLSEVTKRIPDTLLASHLARRLYGQIR